MNATIKRATPRKAAPAKPVKSRTPSNDDVYLASLSPWLREIELLARPLRGKLTKAINQK